LFPVGAGVSATGFGRLDQLHGSIKALPMIRRHFCDDIRWITGPDPSSTNLNE
jgi:hypothetical protein